MEEKAAAEAARAALVPTIDVPEPPSPVDATPGRRLHAWVLVRAGKRDVKEHVFVEPSTGAVYRVGTSPYHRLDALWNNRNYFINMQGGVTDVGKLSFDLAAPDLWEFVFIATKPPRAAGGDEKESKEDAASDDGGGHGGAGGDEGALAGVLGAPKLLTLEVRVAMPTCVCAHGLCRVRRRTAITCWTCRPRGHRRSCSRQTTSCASACAQRVM